MQQENRTADNEGQSHTNSTPVALTAITEAPYTIFDKKQKWLIVFFVSTAATCELCYSGLLRCFTIC